MNGRCREPKICTEGRLAATEVVVTVELPPRLQRLADEPHLIATPRKGGLAVDCGNMVDDRSLKYPVPSHPRSSTLPSWRPVDLAGWIVVEFGLGERQHRSGPGWAPYACGRLQRVTVLSRPWGK